MKIINPSTVAAPIGAYVHGIKATGGNWLVVSGQVGIDPLGQLVSGLEAQCTLIWTNMEAILRDASMDFSHLVKVTSFVLQGQDMGILSRVRASFLGELCPCATTIAVSGFVAPGFLIEIEALAWSQ